MPKRVFSSRSKAFVFVTGGNFFCHQSQIVLLLGGAYFCHSGRHFLLLGGPHFCYWLAGRRCIASATRWAPARGTRRTPNSNAPVHPKRWVPYAKSLVAWCKPKRLALSLVPGSLSARALLLHSSPPGRHMLHLPPSGKSPDGGPLPVLNFDAPHDLPTTPSPDPTSGLINACSGGGRREMGAYIYPFRGEGLGWARWGVP